MERKSERICREGFSRLLLNTLDPEDIHWQPVKDDPPDYFLTLFGQKRFAVEVTEAKIYCKSIMDKEQMLEREYRSYHDSYVKQIEREAKENGILGGAYFIEFKFPVLKSSKYKNFLSELKRHYFQYIRETRHLDSADKQDFFLGTRWISQIKKIHQNMDIIYPTFGMRTAWVNSPQNMQVVKNFLQEAINDKRRKLEKRAIEEQKILLLYDSYLLDDKSTYSFGIESLKDIEYFHTIFIQLAGGEGLIFYSKNPDDFDKNFLPTSKKN
jgi:hypothetical protein